MIQAIRKPATRKRPVSLQESVPAPVGGLNARDAIANMPPTDAVVLENFFPEPSQVSIRNGSASHVTGISGWVESLMPYAKATATKLFAAAGTSFYDVTSPGAVGAAVVTGLTNAQWESVNIGTPAGQFLYAMNGVDKPQLYDGSTWTAIDGVSTPAITGVTTTKLRQPTVWKSRLWAIENNSFRAWYLPTLSIGGAAKSIDLSAYFKNGGQLQTIITCTLSSGNTLDDYIGFLSTEGELAVFSGSDPDSGAFYMKAFFVLGRPVGRRCWFRGGADAIIICSDGFVPISNAIMQGRKDTSQAISDKILNLVNRDVQQYRTNFGWQGILYPLGNKIIINVPQTTDSTSYQYVMNTITGAWTVFTGWNAACFATLQDSLYYGGNGTVYRADYGTSDDGVVIDWKIKPAFNYLKRRGVIKQVKMLRPVFRVNATVRPVVSMNVDFEDKQPTAQPTFSGLTGGLWDVAVWNVANWQAADGIQKNWITTGGVGFAVSPYIRGATKGVTGALQSVDYLFEVGGPLGS